jgi:hypothetical protein
MTFIDAQPATWTRFLKDAKPSDLPVNQATTFALLVNLKTKALGLEARSSLVPPR